MEVKLIVGLEIHVQLDTKTKMFCGCKLAFNDPPNSNVCPICLGMPGVLPTMNRRAYEYAVRTAVALNCEIARFTKWDRKGYYYPDLPKNYQISQYDLPLGANGFLEIPLEEGGSKKIRIRRVHLEEDAGKNLHEGMDHSQVDLNRAGTPLMEIVTEPDLSSPQECRTLAMELQKLVQFLGVSQANMQMGHMRFEPNINLLIEDAAGRFRTPICEIKNLNSFRALERAVAYEQWRQQDQWQRDHNFTLEKLGKQNRGWDDNRNETVFQREKEEAHDYRYFPEPDLVPVVMDEAWLARIKAEMGELPQTIKQRFLTLHHLSEYDAEILTADKETATYSDITIKQSGAPKRVANIITQFGLKIANERGCRVDEIGVTPKQVAKLAEMMEADIVSASAAAALFELMLTDHRDPQQIAQEHHLIQQSDAAALELVVDEVIAANAAAVAEAKSGSKKSGKARGFLLGQVMQKTRGQANPSIAGELLDAKLKS